ncbi:hypothetical protein [Lunatibacter salilacus]|uniref:hypothetical protein n=1 Tax=Lunatibacter salilacus TaxID=2483804 RepID=UPI00131D97F5|nr:hypothetical protein [Lunatibacter salilacus]
MASSKEQKTSHYIVPSSKDAILDEGSYSESKLYQIRGVKISEAKAYQERLNPYTQGLPEEVNAAFTKCYLEFFTLFLKHVDKIRQNVL